MSKINLEIRVTDDITRDQLERFEDMIIDFIWQQDRILSETDDPMTVWPPCFVKSIGSRFEER